MTGITEAIDETPWHRLLHAHGTAADTGRHLKALLGPADQPRRDAVAHLMEALFSQGRPWPATSACAGLLVRMLREKLIDDGSALVGVLRFLGAAGRAGQIEGEEDPLFEQAIVECHDLGPAIFDSALMCVDDADPLVQDAALGTVVSLAHHPGVTDRRREACVVLSGRAATLDVDRRAATVLAVGELGGEPREYLRDPWFAVRVCAALAPALASCPAALEVLAEAISRPRRTGSPGSRAKC